MEIYDCEKSWNLMTAKQVRDFDAYAINELGIPGVVLMENAGRSCAELILEKQAGAGTGRVVIFCGTGNNGGDGFVIARHLINAQVQVRVVICGQGEKIKGDARINLQVLENMGQKVERLDIKPGHTDHIAGQVGELACGAVLIVDAIFGTGLAGPLKEGYRDLIEAINEQGKRILAVDIPSGLNCDLGVAEGAAIRAECTVTFAAVKKGFVNPQAKRYTGRVYVASIGINP